MAAAALPAARQISRPFGTGRRCAASTTSGCAAATAASKIVRRRGRLSVMASRDLRWKHAAPYPSVFGKRKPPRRCRGGECEEGIVSRTRCSALHPGHVRERSASDVAADDVTEQLPPFALETLQLQLADRGKICRAGVDHHAGQKNFGAEILQVGCLFHDVLAGEIVTALLQHLYQGLGNAVS